MFGEQTFAQLGLGIAFPATTPFFSHTINIRNDQTLILLQEVLHTLRPNWKSGRASHARNKKRYKALERHENDRKKDSFFLNEEKAINFFKIFSMYKPFHSDVLDT